MGRHENGGVDGVDVVHLLADGLGVPLRCVRDAGAAPPLGVRTRWRPARHLHRPGVVPPRGRPLGEVPRVGRRAHQDVLGRLRVRDVVVAAVVVLLLPVGLHLHQGERHHQLPVGVQPRVQGLLVVVAVVLGVRQLGAGEVDAAAAEAGAPAPAAPNRRPRPPAPSDVADQGGQPPPRRRAEGRVLPRVRPPRRRGHRAPPQRRHRLHVARRERPERRQRRRRRRRRGPEGQEERRRRVAEQVQHVDSLRVGVRWR